jgi:hypothetical protein
LNAILYDNQISPNENRCNVLKDTFMTFSIVIYSTKNFYLLDEMNEKIQFLQAAGLIEYWFRKSIDTAFSMIRESRKPKKLSLKNMEASFYILCFGCLFSFIVFMIEMFIKKK